MEPVVPGHPSPQPAPSGVTGTRGCTGTPVPGTIFACWLVSPAAAQEQELGFSKPGTAPVEERAVPRARLAQEERLSCGSALHRCHPKATPPSSSPVGVTAPGWAAPGGLCCGPQAGANPRAGLRSELLLAKSGSRQCPLGWLQHLSPHWGPSSCPVLGQGCSWGAPLSLLPPPTAGGRLP